MGEEGPIESIRITHSEKRERERKKDREIGGGGGKYYIASWSTECARQVSQHGVPPAREMARKMDIEIGRKLVRENCRIHIKSCQSRQRRERGREHLVCCCTWEGGGSSLVYVSNDFATITSAK